MNPEIEDLIAALRETQFGWMADEVVEAISVGRQHSKEFREEGARKKTKATAVDPFSADEQMEILIETLVEYFGTLPLAWKQARETFSEKDVFSTVTPPEKFISRQYSPRVTLDGDIPHAIECEMPDGKKFSGFSPEFGGAATQLMSVLAKMWPQGEGHFRQRFGKSIEHL